MTRTAGLLILVLIVLVAVDSARPVLLVLAHTAVGLVLAVGFVAIVLRLVWFLTGRTR